MSNQLSAISNLGIPIVRDSAGQSVSPNQLSRRALIAAVIAAPSVRAMHPHPHVEFDPNPDRDISGESRIMSGVITAAEIHRGMITAAKLSAEC